MNTCSEISENGMAPYTVSPGEPEDGRQTKTTGDP